MDRRERRLARDEDEPAPLLDRAVGGPLEQVRREAGRDRARPCRHEQGITIIPAIG